MKYVIKGLSIMAKLAVCGAAITYASALIGLGYDEAHRAHASIDDVSTEEFRSIGMTLGQRARDGWKWAFNS